MSRQRSVDLWFSSASLFLPLQTIPSAPLRSRKEERRTLEIQSSGGAAKSPTKNMNRKYAAWNTPRSAQSYFAFRLGELAAFQKATIRCCVRPAVGTHQCARRVFVALPRRCGGFIKTALPRWRPSARLTTERYVNEQIPQFPAEHRELYQITAPVIKRGG